ncbi:MAG TPA: VanZ family protein [Verrucomicrobiota bacterium]|nr:VanZ family protein [Verrucomicrobiota bacterium]HRR64193.1 VanZ family protein [Candidatus Paceibacterota bacterium]MBP8013968.1 VanZ family protein [Verrucomicrobiota bacterium]MDI9372911.1 VanZ family protein [Verrucomicrobiota bacterium]NLH84042.1 VanZ family protein [Verrucomicrobiota bacterium]
MPRKQLFIARWLLVLCWMGVIFSASGDQMSFDRSRHIIGSFLCWLVPQLSPEAIHAVVVVLRKCAHVAEYAVLAWLIWWALDQFSVSRAPDWPWPKAGLVLTLVTLYAISDELHQTFIPSRGGCVQDVLLDTLGGALGLLVLWAACRLKKRE